MIGGGLGFLVWDFGFLSAPYPLLGAERYLFGVYHFLC